MDAWLSIVIRQLIIYSLPVLISLTVVAWAEARISGRTLPHAFHAIAWKGTWLPLLAAIAMQRGIIVALSNPVASGVKAAAIRLTIHTLLCALGWLLYSLSLNYQAPTGVPPLHHWWAKVLMYYNLCMLGLHLIPLPTMLAGEILASHLRQKRLLPGLSGQSHWLWITLLAASPILDWALGGGIVYTLYEWLANAAANLHHN